MAETGWQKGWIRVVTTLMTVAVMMMIFAFSMENAEQSDRTSGQISKAVLSVFYPEYEQLPLSDKEALYDNVQHVIRKLAHFTEYTLLGLMIRLCLESWLGYRTVKKVHLMVSGFAAGTGYACTDELHQMAIDGRSGQWTDVLVDASGVLLGVALGTLLIRRINRKTAENAEADDRGEKNGIFQKQ